jgi:hypothetical protein
MDADASLALDDATFLARFEDQSLPLDQWTHRAHVRTAYLYLTALPLEDAIDRVRTGIQAYNAAHDIPDGPTQGYHETMTQAWMRLVHYAIATQDPAPTADEFIDANPQLWQKAVLRFFYTKERFLSPEAKVRYVEPDVIPLPRATT